jgi:transposase
LLSVAVHPANIQDRDGVALVLDRRTRRLFPFIERIYGDGGYQGPKAAKAAAKTGCWTIEIVERSPAAVGFEVLPKRWIVERTFAWLSRFRRLARDFEPLRQNRRRLHPPRHDPHHAEAPRCKILVMNRNFADGLF